MAEKQLNYPLKTLRTDNGGEFTSTAFQTYLHNQGILHHHSCPYTPEKNGRAERKNRHLLETFRALTFTSNLPPLLWTDIILAASYLINILPTPTLAKQSPHQTLFKSPPTYSHLRTIGCLCFPWTQPTSSSKFSPRSLPCIFTGYAPTHKGYKCFDPQSGHTYISRHVRFHEHVFPYQQSNTPHPPDPPTPYNTIITPPLTLTPTHVPNIIPPISPSPIPPSQPPPSESSTDTSPQTNTRPEHSSAINS